jgi:hypothetical protein
MLEQISGTKPVTLGGDKGRESTGTEGTQRRLVGALTVPWESVTWTTRSD